MPRLFLSLLFLILLQGCAQVDQTWDRVWRPSLEATSERAEADVAQAQYDLGKRLLAGDGVQADPAVGFSWVQRAADQGHAEAQYTLGFCYETGTGVNRDDELAALYYRRAVGEPKARQRLSSLLGQKRVKSQAGDPYPAYAAPGCAENGSCYGDTSSVNGMPKTIHVPGYYRKDGTYVRGHYRSRGRR